MREFVDVVLKLRTDAAECALIRYLATNPKKRELFTRLADHLIVLASEVARDCGWHEAPRMKDLVWGGLSRIRSRSTDASSRRRVDRCAAEE
ncbi:hypothetical protein UB31_21340 [Bradyrhizobium sp. LTSP849]|nr:hypothetical protein UB31_21340 [Bradyrhizobium sp. LTSP849]